MRNHEGSIYKSKDGKVWFARLQYTDTTGTRRQKRRRCVSFASAKTMLETLKWELENENSNKVTYRELDAFFRKEQLHKAKIVNGQKVTGFRQDLRIIERYLDVALEFFGDRLVDEITYSDLERFKKQLVNTLTRTGGERSVSDVNQHLRRVRRLFNIAIEQGWLDANPFKRGRSLIEESLETQRTRILTTEEESRLLSHCIDERAHLRNLVIFAIETGCRRGEIGSLRWSDIDIKGRVIEISGTYTKTLRSRLVPISDRLKSVLLEMWQSSRRGDSDLVFGSFDFKHAFGTATRRAELEDVHFHDLRHTAITRMLEKGISPPLVMKISGHSQQKTFMRYVNQTPESIRDIALKLSQAA